MRFVLIILALAATAIAVPAPLIQDASSKYVKLVSRTVVTDIITTLLALLDDLRGGRGLRGSHPAVPLPSGIVTVKATVMPTIHHPPEKFSDSNPHIDPPCHYSSSYHHSSNYHR